MCDWEPVGGNVDISNVSSSAGGRVIMKVLTAGARPSSERRSQTRASSAAQPGLGGGRHFLHAGGPPNIAASTSEHRYGTRRQDVRVIAGSKRGLCTARDGSRVDISVPPRQAVMEQPSTKAASSRESR